MSEIGQRALDWINTLDPAVQAALRQPSYDEKIQQQRALEAEQQLQRLQQRYEGADQRTKIHIISHLISVG